MDFVDTPLKRFTIPSYANTPSRDTFIGAYAVQWVKEKQGGNWDLRSTVEYACKASAQTIQQVGCQESIPWASDLSAMVSPK